MVFFRRVKTTSVHEIVLILHNIRSIQNVGSLFRTADAIGVREIILSGYTGVPLDRYGRERLDFAKTALGAQHSVSWRYAKTLGRVLTQLKGEGFSIVGVEQDNRAVHYKKFKAPSKTALILGNEVRGLSPALRRRCDFLVEIPMRGKKESLNVAVAGGIVLYGLFDTP